jgi:molecular chaperone DnaK (HSP70)
MSPQVADKLVIAVDFGQTNSSVSYTFIPEGCLPESLPNLSPRTVSNYLSGMMTCRGSSMHLEVPTLLRYPRDWVFQPLDELKEEQPGAIHPDNHQIHWGLQVQQDMSRVMSHSDNNQTLLHGFKSLMSQSDNHQVQNERLIETLRRLSQKRSCPREISIHEMLLLVIIDYLTKLLGHAKDEIAGSNAISATEMIICVPVFWKKKALRDMQTCVSIAMKRVNFPGVKFSGGCMEKVFMIPEPEAAATRLLAGPSVIQVSKFSAFIQRHPNWPVIGRGCFHDPRCRRRDVQCRDVCCHPRIASQAVQAGRAS